MTLVYIRLASIVYLALVVQSQQCMAFLKTAMFTYLIDAFANVDLTNVLFVVFDRFCIYYKYFMYLVLITVIYQKRQVCHFQDFVI